MPFLKRKNPSERADFLHLVVFLIIIRYNKYRNLNQKREDYNHMSTWNLDILYTGYDSESFHNDFKALPEAIEKLNTFTETHKELTVESCNELLALLKEHALLENKLSNFIFLNSATDTTDSTTVAYRTKLGLIVSKSAKSMSIIKKLLAKIDLDLFSEQSPLIKTHYFMISEIKERSKHLLGDEAEEAISKMKLNAAEAWSNLHEYLTSTVKVDYNDKELTLPEIRNLAYSEDAEIRKAAYEAELKAYEKIRDSVAFALNSIKGQADTMADLRGYKSVLDMTLVDSRMSEKTLNSMFSAIKKYLPKFQEYLSHKAKLFGHENGLPFYDLFATLKTESSVKFTIEEAREYLCKNFASFSQPVSDLVNQAYEENWIDFYPRKGKVGGAFCDNLPYLKQSRVLMNFDGSLSDVITLAHELGHAYHGKCIENHSILNTDYTMPVAETASTFNETIIMNSAIKDAKTDAEKAMLIESMLQDVTQVICDIYSRFLFESEVVNRRKNEFLLSDELCNIMKNAQKEAYGKGLDENFLHPYMWVNKGHYYIAELNFYNFPYAFGCLFAKGLYAQFVKEPEVFVAKYDKLLNATVISSCEDVAKMADIDITEEQFWIDSLEMMSEYVDEFIRLTK